MSSTGNGDVHTGDGDGARMMNQMVMFTLVMAMVLAMMNQMVMFTLVMVMVLAMMNQMVMFTLVMVMVLTMMFTLVHCKKQRVDLIY